MSLPQEQVKGYLILTIEEASGKTQTEENTWDATSTGGLPFEPFVKVELRGGARSIKAQTHKAPVVDDTVTWKKELRLEVLEGSNELRLMVCREKISNGRKGTAVIAACGIFVSDILEAVPLQKFFQLFRPAPGGEGGYILVSMNYVTSLAELDQPQNVPAAIRGANGQGAGPAEEGKSTALKANGSAVGAVVKALIAGAVLTGVALFARKRLDKKHRK